MSENTCWVPYHLLSSPSWDCAPRNFWRLPMVKFWRVQSPLRWTDRIERAKLAPIWYPIPGSEKKTRVFTVVCAKRHPTLTSLPFTIRESGSAFNNQYVSEAAEGILLGRLLGKIRADKAVRRRILSGVVGVEIELVQTSNGAKLPKLAAGCGDHRTVAHDVGKNLWLCLFTFCFLSLPMYGIACSQVTVPWLGSTSRPICN